MTNSEDTKKGCCPTCGKSDKPVSGGLESAFEELRNSFQPIRAQSDAEANFLARQARGETSSAEDAFGF
jgi:hypothetical protein